MRLLAKQIAEAGLIHSGVGAAVRLRRRRDALVLAYHNVVPAGKQPAGDASLHLPQRRFAAQLDALQRTHDVVPLETLLDEPVRPARRPRAVITFDDAYRGAVTAGVAELAARRMPATIFVAPGFVDGGSFWWDAVSRGGGVGLPDSVRTHALEALGGRDDAVRAWALRQSGLMVDSVPGHARGASLEELHRAVQHDGITLGSHTWSHPNLTQASPSDLPDELTRPLEWLRSNFGRVIPWLAYPYGLSSPAVERAAAEAGYAAALRVSGGWLGPRRDRPFALPRLNVPAGLTLHGFRLRTSGLLCG
jgi:peptidoglycan/xylan/chitin deacetylase (PgdA/CDA1 family)